MSNYTDYVYCANECDFEAERVVLHPDGNATPLCFTCATAYEWGQCSPDSPIAPIEDVELIREKFEHPYTWEEDDENDDSTDN